MRNGVNLRMVGAFDLSSDKLTTDCELLEAQRKHRFI